MYVHSRKSWRRIIVDQNQRIHNFIGYKVPFLALAAWYSGIVSACHQGDWGREIESRQSMYRVVAFLKSKEKVPFLSNHE
jgi:hypothetical protein